MDTSRDQMRSWFDASDGGKPRKRRRLTKAQYVDELGNLKRELKELEATVDDRVANLKTRYGLGVLEGGLYTANIYGSSSTTTDWEALYKQRPELRRIVAKFQTTKPTMVCKVMPK